MHRITEAERRRRLAVRHGLGPHGVGGPPATGPQAGRPAGGRRCPRIQRRWRSGWWHCTPPTRPRCTCPFWPGRRAGSRPPRSMGRCTSGGIWSACWPCAGPCSSCPPSPCPSSRHRRRTGSRRTSAPGCSSCCARPTTVAEPESWLADVERSVLRLLAERGGTATAAELSAAEPRLKTTLVLAAGKPYQATQDDHEPGAARARGAGH